MNREQFVKKVNEVFIETFEMDEETLTPDKDLFTDLGLDSLDIVDLMVEVYKKTGINMRDIEEVRTIRKLGDIYDYLVKWVKENPDKLDQLK
jgi:acyl carrier protein